MRRATIAVVAAISLAACLAVGALLGRMGGGEAQARPLPSPSALQAAASQPIGKLPPAVRVPALGPAPPTPAPAPSGSSVRSPSSSGGTGPVATPRGPVATVPPQTTKPVATAVPAPDGGGSG
jgi:hypothetical protein